MSGAGVARTAFKGMLLGVPLEALTGPPEERLPGVIGASVGSAAGAVTGAATSRMPLMGGFAKGAIPLVVEFGAYLAIKYGLHALEKTNEQSNARWRQLTRIGNGFNATTMLPQSRVLLTQRQESLRAIQTSILNARSSLGNEAALMRRSVDEYL